LKFIFWWFLLVDFIFWDLLNLKIFMAVSCFVTGTDTETGKTLASCALLLLWRRYFPYVVGMKPVAAGVVTISGSAQNLDIMALRAASSILVNAELDNPYCLPSSLSPHLAARDAGELISIPLLVDRYHQLAAQVDAVVVEGAGGFCVPLNAIETGADLAVALAVPIVLVVGLRLGCLNHALLTQDALLRRGLNFVGWVANRIDPLMAAQEENIATLSDLLKAPLWADIPYLSGNFQPELVKWKPAVYYWLQRQLEFKSHVYRV
jgi:dethiobiotin synthetase